MERGNHVSVHDATDNSSDTTAQSESQHGEEDINSGTFQLSDIILHYQYFSVYCK